MQPYMVEPVSGGSGDVCLAPGPLLLAFQRTTPFAKSSYHKRSFTGAKSTKGHVTYTIDPISGRRRIDVGGKVKAMLKNRANIDIDSKWETIYKNTVTKKDMFSGESSRKFKKALERFAKKVDNWFKANEDSATEFLVDDDVLLVVESTAKKIWHSVACKVSQELTQNSDFKIFLEKEAFDWTEEQLFQAIGVYKKFKDKGSKENIRLLVDKKIEEVCGASEHLFSDIFLDALFISKPKYINEYLEKILTIDNIKKYKKHFKAHIMFYIKKALEKKDFSLIKSMTDECELGPEAAMLHILSQPARYLKGFTSLLKTYKICPKKSLRGAVEANYVDGIDFLLSKHDYDSEYLQDLLREAVKHDDLGVTQLFLKRGVNPYAALKSCLYSLSFGIVEGWEEYIYTLFAFAKNMNKKQVQDLYDMIEPWWRFKKDDAKYIKALLYALLKNNTDVLWIEKKDKNKVIWQASSSLHVYPSLRDKLYTDGWSFDHDIKDGTLDPNTVVKHYWLTLLHYAVMNQAVEKVKILLKYGANVHQKCRFGLSPLQMAQHMYDRFRNEKGSRSWIIYHLLCSYVSKKKTTSKIKKKSDDSEDQEGVCDSYYQERRLGGLVVYFRALFS